MKIAFLFFLYLGFAFPQKYIVPIGFALEYREIAYLLLPIINLFIKSENRAIVNPVRIKRIRRIVYIYLISILITEFLLKQVIFNQSFFDSVKCIRYGLPLFTGLILFAQGLRVSVDLLWRTFLFAVVTSVVLSFINLLYPLPFSITPNDEKVKAVFTGRIGNLNFSFGLIGLYLLFQKRNEPTLYSGLAMRTSIASVVALIISFNRTYLAILLLEFGYFLLKRFSLKNVLKVTIATSIVVAVLFFFYENNERLQNQLDKRIFLILDGEVSLVESTIENNRDYIFEGVYERISEGYWVLGLPYSIPIFIRQARYDKDEMYMSKTDTSLANHLLRHGIFPFLLLSYIFFVLLKFKIHIFNFIFTLYLLASLNIDALYSHNSVFFVLFVFMISTHSRK